MYAEVAKQRTWIDRTIAENGGAFFALFDLFNVSMKLFYLLIDIDYFMSNGGKMIKCQSNFSILIF